MKCYGRACSVAKNSLVERMGNYAALDGSPALVVKFYKPGQAFNRGGRNVNG